MTSFIIQRDEDGVEYVSLAHNPHTKNHQDPNEPHKENLRGFMFARPGDPLCPVKSFKKYISTRCKIFWTSDVWYSRELMGVHYLGNMLKKISEEWACRRSTPITASGAQLWVGSLTPAWKLVRS